MRLRNVGYSVQASMCFIFNSSGSSSAYSRQITGSPSAYRMITYLAQPIIYTNAR